MHIHGLRYARIFDITYTLNGGECLVNDLGESRIGTHVFDLW